MFDSVRVRLTLWYSLFLACALVLLASVTYWVVKRSIRERTDSAVKEIAQSFLITFDDELRDSSDVAGAARQAMIEHRDPDHAFAILDSNGRAIADFADLPYPEFRGRRFSEARARSCAVSGSASDGSFRTIGGLRCYAQRFLAEGNSYVLVVAASLHAEREMLGRIRLAFDWLIPLAIALAAIGGYLLVGKTFAPVVAMGAQAQRIGASNLHERLAVQNPADELGRLAATFNDLLDRLGASFERQRRFIADASHELRTPVAILRGEAEVALSRPSRSVEEYRESLTILHLEAKRLTRIVEDLFTLTRADSGQYPLSPSEFYLDELVADCVHSVRSLAAAKDIAVGAEPCAEQPIRGDEGLLRRMLLNLLDNAIKYTPRSGKVTVTCRSAPGGVEISVHDSGPGIPAEWQGRVFERFFRGDPVRSRTSADAGAGLGLSIARWIAEAHQGRLELTRSDASGTVFTVFLPRGSTGVAVSS
jgi:two-component system OmpR family sensor kinase